MGLNKNDTKVTYLGIADGKFVRSHKEANENTVTRTNKKGRVVHEEFFSDLTGKLTDIAIRDTDFGKQWQLKLESDGEVFYVQMDYSGRYSSSFLKVLPNLNLKEDMKIKPWSMKDQKDPTKKFTGLTVYQGPKILPAYTKEEPNGLPEMVQRKVKGVMVWDDTEMMEFLENMVNTKIKPKLQTKAATTTTAPVAAIENHDDDDEPEEDDLPF